jgi:sensor histidine kinase regulating citrate/malate metabolism
MAALDSMEVENSRLVDTIVFSQRQLVESSTYGAIKEIQEKQMKMAHDIRNHISAVLALQNADSGCDDEYIDRVVNEVLQSSSVVDCNNLTVNAILNLKYTEAVKNGVDILFDINDLSGIQIMEKDLVTILSNAIDNAIENTKEDSNRVIQIKLNDNEYRTVFSIINPSKELVINEGIIQTTKEDKGRHGYGLKNIKSAVENNNGIMVTKYENGYFKLTVVFNK